MKFRTTLGVILIALLVCLGGCRDKTPKRTYKYTVWVGSAMVASGYGVDEYLLTSDTITFTTSSGKTKIVPICSLMGIDEEKSN